VEPGVSAAEGLCLSVMSTGLYTTLLFCATHSLDSRRFSSHGLWRLCARMTPAGCAPACEGPQPVRGLHAHLLLQDAWVRQGVHGQAACCSAEQQAGRVCSRDLLF
jgi:hypothetical protein